MPASPRYGSLAALALGALPHRGFVVDVARRWSGYGVVWLHLLVALGWVPVAVVEAGRIQARAAEVDAALVGMPRVLLWDGEARVSGPQPWVARDAQGRAWWVVDTTGALTGLEGHEARALLTRTHLHLGERRVSLALLPTLMVDEELARALVADLARWARWLVYPLVVAVDVTWRAGLALVAAAALHTRARALGLGLGLAPTARLAVMAGVGPFWAAIALRLLGLGLPLQGLLEAAWGAGMAAWAAQVLAAAPAEPPSGAPALVSGPGPG